MEAFLLTFPRKSCPLGKSTLYLMDSHKQPPVIEVGLAKLSFVGIDADMVDEENFDGLKK